MSRCVRWEEFAQRKLLADLFATNCIHQMPHGLFNVMPVPPHPQNEPVYYKGFVKAVVQLDVDMMGTLKWKITDEMLADPSAIPTCVDVKQCYSEDAVKAEAANLK